ncbi:MAG: two-component regulator propeller domain-containing protein [Bacteroidota bacterium]
MMFRKYFWILLCLLFGQTVFGQPIQKIRFKNIRKSEGLSNNMVHGLLRDNLGFLWFATNDGLCRYDGPDKLEVFREDPAKNSLVSSNIRSIYQDSRGNLWLGTRLGGLTKYHRESETWTTYQHDANDSTTISNDEILRIVEDSHQRLWIGTEYGLNLFDYQTETFTRYLADAEDSYKLQTKAVLDIFEDEKGWIWVGTWAGGLHLLLTDEHGKDEAGQFRNIIPASNTASRNVWRIFQDRQKRYWVGTHGGGLFLMQLPLNASNYRNRQQWAPQFHNYIENPTDDKSLASNGVQDIMQDRSGNLWIATGGHGVNFIANEQLPDPRKYNAVTKERPILKFTNFYFDPKDYYSLAGNNVTEILEDEQGLMWFATSNGVSQYNWYANQFDAHELFKKGRKTSIAKNLYVDANQKVWIGGGQYGLVEYDLKQREMVNLCTTHPQLFLNDYVSAILPDGDNGMYVATKFGVSYFDRATHQYEKYPMPEKIRSEMAGDLIQVIFKDRNNQIWLGTEAGLCMLDLNTRRYTQYFYDPNDPQSISDNSITDIIEDHEGNLWVATYNGLNKVAVADIAEFKCQRFFHDKENPDNTIVSNQITNLKLVGQKLYLGYMVGLGSYDLVSEKFTNHSSKDHKFWVQSVETTSDGHLWGSTTQGLFYFNTQQKTFSVFEKVDGLSDLSFLPKSSAQDQQGNIYFGTRSGFTKFNAGKFLKNTQPPTVYITKIKVINAEREVTYSGINRKEIVLNHDDYYFSINFAALNYNRAEKNQYAYKLEGFDEDWQYTDFGIPIVYTNLSPQSYTFRVKATNNDGVWSEEAATLTINKKPAFWQTWWFQLGSVLLIILLITAGIKKYTSNIRATNLRLQQYNDDLGREIEVRKGVEKALAHKEQFARLIMDNIPQFIYWMDKDCNFLGGNRTFVKYVQLESNADLIGRNLADFYVQGADYDEEMKLLKQVIGTEKGVYRKVSLSLPSAHFSQLWVERNFVPLRNDDGQVIGVLVSGRDISDTVNKERLLTENATKLGEYNKELKRSNQDLEQFAYIASHDLNEPLRMIGNFSGLIAKRYKNALDEDANQYIGFIENGVSRMAKLINSLLTYSRVGRKEIKYMPVELDELLEGKLMDLSQVVQDRKVEVQIDPLPTIFGEREQIGMVFYNLINNGIKFNRKKRPQIIVRHHEQPNAEHWKFSVTDNGIGIAPEYQHKIFEIFKRLHNKRDFEGTGIGLSVCQKIVFRHGGKIWIESTLGEGTTFYFTISKLLKSKELMAQKGQMVVPEMEQQSVEV